MKPNLVKMLVVCCALPLFLLVGCAGPGGSGSPATTPSANGKQSCHAECLVCKYDADLACIDVDVDKTTPTYDYNGKTYYFCSKECHDKFAKNPPKYVAGN